MEKKFIVNLSQAEEECLTKIVTSGKASAAKIKHAHILLKANRKEQKEEWTDEKISEAFSCSLNTVKNIRQRFVELGFEQALERKPLAHSPRPKKLDGSAEAFLIATACSKVPDGYSKWTMRLLGDKLIELKIVETVSNSTICRTLKKTNYNRI
jgi:hypothetical protein